MDLDLVVLTDSTAAKGLGGISGHGKAKHIATRLIWLQGGVRRKELTLAKVSTEQNTADMHTKALDAARLEKLMIDSGEVPLPAEPRMHPPWRRISLRSAVTPRSG